MIWIQPLPTTRQVGEQETIELSSTGKEGPRILVHYWWNPNMPYLLRLSPRTTHKSTVGVFLSSAGSVSWHMNDPV